MNFSSCPTKEIRLTSLVLAFLVCLGWIEASLGQNNSELINVSIYDPFLKPDASTTHFRPVYFSVSLATPGAVAQRDHEFFAVNHLSSPYRYTNQRERLSWRRFSLAKGQSSVDAELLLHSSETGPTNSMDNLFLETDGDLRFSGSIREFAALNLTRGTTGQPAENPKFLFVFDDSLLEQFFTREIQVDLKSGRRTPGFEVTRRPQFSVRFPALPDPHRLPNIRDLNRIFDATNTAPHFSGPSNPNPPPDLDIRDHFASSNFLFQIAPKYFPTTWKGLIGFDFVVLKHRDLLELSRRDDPRQIESLQKWIVAGGRLVVTDCGRESREARLLEAALFEQTLGPDQTLWPSEWISIDDWSKVTGFESALDPDPESFGGRQFIGNRLASVSVSESAWNLESPMPERGVSFEHGLGRVIAWPGDADDLTLNDWKSILLSAYANGGGSRPETTIGLGHLTHQWMYDFKLPGLGDPPQFVFLGLICLFALTVGPLAYWWFYRCRRLSFLLVVVPVLSGMATTCLLLYAVLASGLAFRSQRFSLTRLDQRSRTAVTVTEQAIFSGVNPKAYACNRDQFLFIANDNSNGSLQVESIGDGHQFLSPEIRARTLHQVTAVEVQRTDRRLQVVRRQMDGGEMIEVSNQLGSPITVGYVRWQDRIYQFRNLEPDATAIAQPVDQATLESELQIAQGLRPGNKPVNYYSSSYMSYSQVETTTGYWGLCQTMSREPYPVASRIKSGEYLCLLDNFDGACELKPEVQYHSQLHLVHGDW